MAKSDAAAIGPRIRILVVDDSSLVRLYYRNILEKSGFEVEQAINGIEAIEKVQAQAFNLVVVDVNMPKMDGFSFLRALRRSAPSVASLPALVITTENSEQDLDDARKAGANFYLVKPVAESDLLSHAALLTGAAI
jgi:two-component system, chemotaxis family, chemotaxis protein CheY